MIRRTLGAFALLLSIPVLSTGTGAAAHSAATRPFSVTITHVECVDSCDAEGLEAALEGHADFYAKVFINGVKQPPGSDEDDPSTPIHDNSGSIDPNWTVATQIPDTVVNVPVTIQIWDYDSTSGDDLGDVSPRNGDNNLDFRVSYSDGRWIDHTGNEDNVNWPQNCSTGDGGDDDEPRVKVCFEIGTDQTTGDSDGDSLLDGWELNGINVDGDNDIDVDLPGMGAQTGRKDLFLEIDCLFGTNHTHCPLQGAVQDVVQAFANAPVSNPDGSTGIQLHVDVGNLYGHALNAATNVPRTAPGVGGMRGNFGNFGGGGDQINEAGNLVVDWDGATGRAGTNFFTLKNFNADRERFFRYNLWAHQNNLRAAANDCTSGWERGTPAVNFMVTLGGTNASGNACWGTNANGLSVGSRAEQAGTLMHEFGHTLGLAHGGGDGVNNKPNYLSVMNYTFQQCGVTAAPPALPGGCDYSRHNLPSLNEMLPPGMDECVGIGGGLGLGGVDWDGVGGLTGTTCPPPPGNNVSANVNGDFNDTNGNGSQDPGETAILTTLNGSEDWNRIFYDFRSLPNYQTGGTPGTDEPDPASVARARAEFRELVRPALTVDVTGPADATPGGSVDYSAKVTNTGRGPALSAEMTVTPPGGTATDHDLGTFKATQVATRPVHVAVACDTADGTVLTAKASAKGEDMLGGEVSGSDTASTTVRAPVVTLHKTATATVNAGEAITYRIAYQNTGGGAAGDVKITDVLPAGVYYSTPLDTGAGPKPASVVLNPDGTRTFTWNVGDLAANSGEKVIEYKARPTLLALPGDTFANSAKLTFTNAAGCVYAPVTDAAETTITAVTPSRLPMVPAIWLLRNDLRTPEILARVQATDTRYDGADGTAPNGELSLQESSSVLLPPVVQPRGLRAELQATLLNTASRRINAGTRLSTVTTRLLNLDTVGDAVRYAQTTLAQPPNLSNLLRYTNANLVLTEINTGIAERY
ncbi:hypothetical protein [Spongiactinospora sp. TRM90649]|uniref:hypothetical protein n=1 Tax=Spongiactinospora sp. TRM90649 TaxID=3031114 RepID=UPI0023F6899A|nr:hypothetical protein [Spongiactinospora sp. TRM90649]MDF5751168.1 hypothetical protein [Spongiactinospora sp. TRM90649]